MANLLFSYVLAAMLILVSWMLIDTSQTIKDLQIVIVVQREQNDNIMALAEKSAAAAYSWKDECDD